MTAPYRRRLTAEAIDAAELAHTIAEVFTRYLGDHLVGDTANAPPRTSRSNPRAAPP